MRVYVLVVEVRHISHGRIYCRLLSYLIYGTLEISYIAPVSTEHPQEETSHPSSPSSVKYLGGYRLYRKFMCSIMLCRARESDKTISIPNSIADPSYCKRYVRYAKMTKFMYPSQILNLLLSFHIQLLWS
jgi:hypothetical protein